MRMEFAGKSIYIYMHLDFLLYIGVRIKQSDRSLNQGSNNLAGSLNLAKHHFFSFFFLSSLVMKNSIVMGTMYCKKHRPLGETLNRGPDSLCSQKK